MRLAACRAWQAMFTEKPFVFMTGDLGFMALEPLRETMGPLFVNAGVAEQNMVSVAAGLARTGLGVWVYSIPPFLYARALEQIRNDVCLNRLPVFLAGYGGGYAYGVMGPTHHALEDYGVLLALQDMHAVVPAFADDVEAAVRATASRRSATYLRLGRCEKPAGFAPPAFAPWRRLAAGAGPVLVAVGPLAGALLARLLPRPENRRAELWALGELPSGVDALPEALIEALRDGRPLCVVEEHVEQGSAGHLLLARLVRGGCAPWRFIHLHARGYPDPRYGSQEFHRRASGIDADAVIRRLDAEC